MVNEQKLTFYLFKNLADENMQPNNLQSDLYQKEEQRPLIDETRWYHDLDGWKKIKIIQVAKQFFIEGEDIYLCQILD